MFKKYYKFFYRSERKMLAGGRALLNHVDSDVEHLNIECETERLKTDLSLIFYLFVCQYFCITALCDVALNRNFTKIIKNPEFRRKQNPPEPPPPKQTASTQETALPSYPHECESRQRSKIWHVAWLSIAAFTVVSFIVCAVD